MKESFESSEQSSGGHRKELNSRSRDRFSDERLVGDGSWSNYTRNCRVGEECQHWKNMWESNYSHDWRN